MRLQHKMRTDGAPEHAQFLLRVGDGSDPTTVDDKIKIPDEMVVDWDDIADEDTNLWKLIEEVYPGLADNVHNVEFLTERGILATKNDVVDKINDLIIAACPGEEHVYHSFDSVPEDIHNLYQQEVLNALTSNGLPPHKLTLKPCTPIIRHRNLDPAAGLCNGTRLICREFHLNVIDTEIIAGSHEGLQA